MTQTSLLSAGGTRPSDVPRIRNPSQDFGKLAACVWFMCLAALYGHTLPELFNKVHVRGGAFAAWSILAARLCAMFFMVTLSWLMLRRREAVAKLPDKLPQVVALAATYGVWIAPLLPAGAPTPNLTAASAALTLLGSILLVASIAYLRRSFSLAPQARALVVTGPYRFVRNPLYLAEAIVLTGILIQSLWYAAVPFFILHLALQLRRILWEEAVMRGTWPEYAAYAKRTARLIPGLW